MFIGLVVVFCALASAALGVSIWVYVSAQNYHKSVSARPLTLPGPRGPTGRPGYPGPAGSHGQFRRLDVEHLRWESQRRDTFLEFKAEAQGYFCSHTGCGELVVTGEMQVRNPPSGKNSALRTVRVWVPHDVRIEGEEADWDVPFDVQYTGWRSSESTGTFTRDEQEDFRVICLRPATVYETRDLYPYRSSRDEFGAESWNRGREGDLLEPRDELLDRPLGDRLGRDRLGGDRLREPTVLEFGIIVQQGDEQVGLTPFETVLPLHRRHKIACREVD
jgi:hypothetical protein